MRSVSASWRKGSTQGCRSNGWMVQIGSGLVRWSMLIKWRDSLHRHVVESLLSSSMQSRMVSLEYLSEWRFPHSLVNGLPSFSWKCYWFSLRYYINCDMIAIMANSATSVEKQKTHLILKRFYFKLSSHPQFFLALIIIKKNKSLP